MFPTTPENLPSHSHPLATAAYAVQTPRQIALTFMLSVVLLGGCASSPLAPVESRTGAIGQPRAGSPAIVGDTGTTAGSPATGATVIPLGSDSGPEPGAPAAVASAKPQPPATSARPVNPAVVALLNRANQQSGAGQHSGAASSLERAIKIDPGNAWLWHRLAATRLDQGRPGDAASLAAKSNSLAAGDPELQADNWRLIARVHRARGEDVAARAAEVRARRLSTPRT